MQILGRVVALALLALPLMAASPRASAPDDPAANLNALFSRLRATKDPAEAQVVEGMIITIWATSPSATANLLYQRGVVSLAAGDKELALDLFTACTSLQPEFGEAWHQLGVVNFAMNANDEALLDLEHALTIEPRNYGALLQLAAIFANYGNQHASLQALRRALAVNPHIDGLEQRIEAMSRDVEGQGI